jgi:hypothetical protein
VSFHAPNVGRVTTGQLRSSEADAANGVFCVLSVEPGWSLLLIVSDGLGWEHVSIHAFQGRRRQRTPTWKEMCQIKDLCWGPDDVVVQYHPAKSDYVNYHQHTLHLWRPTAGFGLSPPSILVGPLDRSASHLEAGAQ